MVRVDRLGRPGIVSVTVTVRLLYADEADQPASDDAAGQLRLTVGESGRTRRWKLRLTALLNGGDALLDVLTHEPQHL